MRFEAVIAVPSSDTVGPTRLKLLTARTGKLPVVVVFDGENGPEYHVLTMSALQAALTGQLSGTALHDALDLAASTPREPVAKSDIASAAVGTPVVENGRLNGVVLDDRIEAPEPTEQDLDRGAPSTRGKAANGPASNTAAESGRKRGLWSRITGPNR